MNRSTIIAVDFDGTCVTHEYPAVGRNIGAQSVLKELVAAGCRIILWTMRSGIHLDQAVYWFKTNGIPLYGVQQNPEQTSWTDSPKAYAQLYIDDAALGCPLIHPPGEKPYVDWKIARKLLHHLIPPRTPTDNKYQMTTNDHH